MTDLPPLSSLALRVATLRVLLDQVSRELKSARETLHHAMTTTGAARVVASLPDGTQVASTSTVTPKPKVVITDPAVFAAWVREHRPTEVRQVLEVRRPYQDALLAEMAQAGAPEIADPDTGEMHKVPGVDIRPTRTATYSTRVASGGAEAIMAAWRGGQLPDLHLHTLSPAPTSKEAPGDR